jgi:uncharacterized lipoprotein YddW (UPF0748 family)
MSSPSLSLFGRVIGVLSLSSFASLAMAQSLGPVTTTVLRDFEDNLTTGFAAVTNSNSAAANASNTGISNVSETGSRRLRLDNASPLTINGAVVTLPNAIPGPGNWLITADIKVVNTNTSPQTNAIDSFGMATKLGAPSTAKIPDANAGFVMNLFENFANSTSLGYQTVGARVQAPSSLSYPQDLTLYFSTDPSGGTTSATTSFDGNFNGTHRVTTNNWQSTSNHVLIDNIKRIGPGSLDEDRILWISIGDGLTNQTSMENFLVQAKNNDFTAVSILARYRANRFYRANRTFSTYTNPEPAHVASVDSSFDPLQYAIDRGRELGLRVYASFSCFIVTDGVAAPYPSFLPSNYRTWVYDDGTPAVQTTANGDHDGLWVDPGYSAVRDYTREVMMDLVENYDVDGIIFDRIRYADQNHGYNPSFLTEAGISGTPAPSNPSFREARRRGVSTFLQEAYTSATALKPWLIVGTVPVAYANNLASTYNDVFQAYYQWNTFPGGSRVVSFGSQDLIQPQFYRQWDTNPPNNGPQANERLMGMMLWGDTASFSRDIGMSPGALTNVVPLFWWGPSFTDAADVENTGYTVGTNALQSRNIFSTGLGLQGWGVFAATQTFNTFHGRVGINELKTRPSANPLQNPSRGSDFLFKAGYDNTPPTTVPVFSIQSLNPISVTLQWSTPAPAADGETPAHYLLFRSTNPNVRTIRSNQLSVAQLITANSYTDSTFSTGGPYYYKIVPVDDYNNWGPASELGPVTPPAGGNIVLESRNSSGSLTASPTYREFGSWSNTTSKSTATNPPVMGDGSRFATASNTSATLTPQIIYGGFYDVYVTLANSTAGPSNNATVDFTILNYGPPVTGSVSLNRTDATLTNTWKKIATAVPLTPGQTAGITFSNPVYGTVATPPARFCVDAVWYQLVSFGPAPLPVQLTNFQLDE